jgi:hypothetical protein
MRKAGLPESRCAIFPALMAVGGELYVCTWLYAESPDEESVYYQSRGHPSSESFQAVYWRCVALFFATSCRHQPEARHVLFTNVEAIPTVDGQDVEALLRRFGVQVILLPLTFQTPPGYYHAWRNQFYVFDILFRLNEDVGDEDAVLVLDSDCVWIASAAPMQDALRRDGVLTYVQPYAPDWPANGLTREEMRNVANRLSGVDVPHPLIYCGGELVAATGAELTRITSEVELTWRGLMDLHRQGEPVFTEEGQTLSYVYDKLGYPLGNGSPFVRRIWTGSLGAHNTALPEDHGLVVWHLPAEKRFGIERLFPQVFDPRSELWSRPLGRELPEYLGSHLGVPSNSLRKRARDFGRRAADRFRSG